MWHCLGRCLMILSSTPLQLQGKMQPYAAVTKTYKFDKSLVEVKRCWICKKWCENHISPTSFQSTKSYARTNLTTRTPQKKQQLSNHNISDVQIPCPTTKQQQLTFGKGTLGSNFWLLQFLSLGHPAFTLNIGVVGRMCSFNKWKLANGKKNTATTKWKQENTGQVPEKSTKTNP